MPVTTNTRKLAALLGASGAGIGTDGLMQSAGIDTDMATQVELDAATPKVAPELALVALKSTATELGKAGQESYPKYNLMDQTIDGFADNSGVDTGNSTNEVLIPAGYYVGQSTPGNWFGDGSDGAFTSDGSDTQTVQNKNGSYDGDMLVRQYTTFNVQSGHTFTPDQPCRGMLIYVQGNVTINGTLTMDARGAYANPHVGDASDGKPVDRMGLRLPMLKSGQSATLAKANYSGCGTSAVNAVSHQAGIAGNGYIFFIERLGNEGGGLGGTIGGNTSGADGTNAVGLSGGEGMSGGGGSGGKEFNPGMGGIGTCFTGGSGGGGCNSSNTTKKRQGLNGQPYGGRGGNRSETGPYGSGGAGNPGGTGNGSSGANGSNGTGGLIILHIGGDFTGSGNIYARGQQGGQGSGNGWPSGGGSGGGNILITYAGSGASTPNVALTGGAAGVTPNANGAAGGAGSSKITSVTGLPTFADLTLQSNATTALATPTKANITLLYSDGGSSTTTINTDIKAYVSRNGSAFTSAITLVAKGTTGTNSILSATDVDISGITTGTSMKWKITTHNQGANKQTRIHAVSLGWS